MSLTPATPNFDAGMSQPLPNGQGVEVAALVKQDLAKIDMAFMFPPEDILNPEILESIYMNLCGLAWCLRLTLPNPSSENVMDDVAADIEARVRLGENKYGERLTTHNGRNALLDAYQELLDGMNYLRQKLYEVRGS